MFDEAFVRNSLTPTLAIIGAFFGLLGTSMGIFNLYLSWRSHWVRASLTWKVKREPYISGTGSHCFFIELYFVNNSYFPVAVREAGIVFKKSLFKREYFPCFYSGMLPIEARHGHEFDAVIGPALAVQQGFATNFISHDEARGASGVYVMLADGRYFCRKQDVLRSVESLCSAIDQQQRKLKAAPKS